MKKLTFLLFIISFISCDNKKHVDTSPQVRDEVNSFYDDYLAHLSTKGLVGIDAFFSQTEHFYWAEDGKLTYPNYQTFKTFVDSLILGVETIKTIEIHRKVDVVNAQLATIFSEKKENVTLTTGDVLTINGATTFLVVKENDSWKFLNAHTSTKKQ